MIDGRRVNQIHLARFFEVGDVWEITKADFRLNFCYDHIKQ